MKQFSEKIKEICKEYEKVGIFVDMDGTTVELEVYQDDYLNNCDKGIFINAKEVTPVIESIKSIKDIENLEIFVLSLARTTQIKKEKQIWLENHMPFIKKENYIILNKEIGEYTPDNRDEIKSIYMEKKLNDFNFVILLDDDIKILKKTQKKLEKKAKVYHISSIII